MFDKVIINAFISSMLLLAANEASASGSEKSRKSEKLEKSGKVPKPACPPTMYWNSTEYNMVQLRSTPISDPLNVLIKCTDYNFCVGDDLIVDYNVYSGPTFETKIGKFHATVKVVDIESDGTDIDMFNAAIKNCTTVIVLLYWMIPKFIGRVCTAARKYTTRYTRMTYRYWVASVSSQYTLLIPNDLSDDLVCTVIILHYLSFF